MRAALAVVILLAACGACGDKGSPAGEDAPASCEAWPMPDVTGEGTYYDADGTGNCGFDADPQRLVAALNAPDWDGSAHCGACVQVTGPDATIVVRVVDQCPGCAHGDLDLSREAFAMIAPLAAGRVPITWHEVACDVTGPIRYRFKDGSNPFWTAIQIRNGRYPVAALEARAGDGSWRAIPRVDYNYFVADPGLGDGPYALRVTDQRGHALVDEGVALGDAVERSGGSQFPSCPAP